MRQKERINLDLIFLVDESPRADPGTDAALLQSKKRLNATL